MKKNFTLVFVLGILLTSCVSNNQDSTTSDLISTPPISESDFGITTDKNEIAKIWDDTLNDETHGFAHLNDIASASYLRNGELLSTFPDDLRAVNDNKFEFYNTRRSHVRYVDKSNGYAMTFPLSNNKFDVDYTLAKYRLQVNIADSVINMSMEKNAYSGDPTGYNIYVGEWFDRYINNPEYLKDNNLSYFAPTLYRTLDILPGFEVTIWNILINDSSKLERPYYHIVIIRELDQYQKFLLMNVKSSSDQSNLIIDLINSYTTISARGIGKNYFEAATPSLNPKWNDETKAYYQKLLKKEGVDFGMFTKSMPNDDSTNWKNIDRQLKENITRLESQDQGLGHEWEIMPTYTHIGWGNELHHFPNLMAAKYAGGNGYNDRPVLQFTYQFTTNNNAVSPGNTTNLNTPMFDILRGKYDNHLIRLAQDIKSYHKPVLFRLNNEMNTDWTSYCGMMTIGDPEIFNMTWRYLFNIFESEGVDNAIWIWNPAHTSIPYSNWGEDLAYYPGHEYVHILGLTHYEMNNRDGNIQSFKQMYQDVYNKNNTIFGELPWIISEFACGSGGNDTGLDLYRNQPSQAAWVTGMMSDWKNRANNPFMKNIVGAVWFNCHDYASDLIVNSLALDPSLTNTIAAFRNGFDAIY